MHQNCIERASPICALNIPETREAAMPYDMIRREAADFGASRYSPSIVILTIAAFAKVMIVTLRLAMAMDLRLQRQRTRRFLSELTAHELKDIGLTRAQARCEAARRWWD
jgi:uncharacterized protein YjiS (DUF1127 family)